MSKSLKGILLVLILMIGTVAIFYYSHSTNSVEQYEAKVHVSSEEMKIQTITKISNIVVDQLLANLILNIEIIPEDKQQNIVLSLQASEFQTEDILLKDSYNVLKEMNQLENVQSFTLKWFMPVTGKNTETLTMSFDQQALLALKDYTYNDLKQLALSYTKQEFLK